MNPEPVVLEGEFVRLEPLTMAHLAALSEIALDEELWRWTTARVTSVQDLESYIQIALDDQKRGTAIPFATIDKRTGRPIGSTRFGNIDRHNKRAEIGWTWIGTAWQRTAANTEAKYLMLSHAFETWNCIRVELKTDSLNQKSRNAILRIGAIEEGTFRNHMIVYNGRFRHSVYFSVIESEWPLVKGKLREKLARSTEVG